MKIQPCPFCGGKDSSRREASGGGYFRECYHCNAKGPWRADAGEADTVWNHSVTAALTKERDEAETRLNTSDLRALEYQGRIAALEKALRVFGRHNPDCLYHVNEPQSTVSQCTCGFSAALAGGKETK